METEQVMFGEGETNDKRCRICLEIARVPISLLDFANPKEEELTYWDILLQFCVIETGDSSKAPQSICTDCAKNMENCYGFKILCENSDKVLKDELSPNTSEDDDCPQLSNMDTDFKVELSEEKINLGTQNFNEDIKNLNNINKELDTLVEETKKLTNEEPQDFNPITISVTEKPTSEESQDFNSVTISRTKKPPSVESQDFNPVTIIEAEKPTSEESQDFNPISISDESNDANLDFELVDPDHTNDDDLISLSSDDEQTTKCVSCDLTFENESVYKQHMTMRHSDDGRLSERMSCGYKPLNLEDYNNHRLKHKSNHKNSRRLKCPHCTYFLRGQNLNSHMLKEHGEKKIGCSYCEELIFKPNCLIRHMKLKHPDKNIVCTLCDFKSEVHDLYYEHMKDCHKDFFEVRKCDFCDYTSISVISLGKHMTMFHDDKKTLKCKLCDKCFFSEKTRQRHEKSHEDMSRFYCETCGKSYKHKRDLNNHMDGHSNDKVIECTVCNKKFNRLDNYISHKRSHSDERSFKCEECGNCFKRRQGLNNHIDRVHKKIKKCECSICFKKFSTGNELKVHMKRHSGLKEVHCEFCDKSFCRNWELKQHMVVHTGERRFVCEVCGKGFTQAQVLRGHMKTHNR